jgi:predicted nucleotidyltransferase
MWNMRETSGSEALGRKVDLLTEGALSPYLRERILNEMRVVYGER